MHSLNVAPARAAVLVCLCLCPGWGAEPRDAARENLSAIATNANATYCFARVRGLDPGRLPPSYLVLKLRVMVSYRNAGTRPLIVPLARERTVFTALNPGPMNVFHEPVGLFDPAVKVMKDLPPDVGPDSPLSKGNDVFTVIPAGGEMTPPLMEEITLPVNRTALFRHYPDLRGHRVYIKLRFVHQELTAALDADLSDRWSRFGVPWTGTLTTNTFLIDVPAAPEAAPCADSHSPPR